MSGAVRRTPLVACPALSAGGAEVALKLENLQRTGSFKLRGAMAKLEALDSSALARGVVASSAGNHGAGIALAARARGVTATVVVPRTTPDSKRRRIAGLGGDLVVAGDGYDDAEREARRIAAERGAVFVSPFDDDTVIAGNGDGLAAELLAQQPAVRQVIAPVGGGGLIGGMARRLAPAGIRMVGVQPENNCAMYDSLAGGAALTEYQGRPTLAEGCEGAVAERTYALAVRYVDSIELVSETAIRRAVAFCYRRLGLVVECSAAVAIAGLIEDVVRPVAAGVTVVVVSGGNIEDDLLDEILAEFEA